MYYYTALVELKIPTGSIGRTLFVSRNANGSVNTIANDDSRVPAGNRTLLQFGYNGNQLTSVTDTQGARSVHYDWSAGGVNSGQLHNVYQINQPANGANPLWQYGYATVDTWTLLKSITVPNPTATPGLIPTVSLTYDTGGRVTQVADENGYVRRYAYNSGDANPATQVTVPTDPNDATAFQQWTQYYAGNRDAGTNQTYAGTDIATSAFYAESNPYLVSFTTDANNATRIYHYDGSGNLVSMLEPANADNAAGGDNVLTSYQYNATINPLGWLKEIDTRAEDNTHTLLAGKAPTKFDYYPATTTDMNNFVIGLLGQVHTIHTPTPGTVNANTLVDTTFTYTALGNVASVTMPGPNSALGAVPGTFTTNFGYAFDPFLFDNVPNALEALGEPLTVTSPFKTEIDPNTQQETTTFRTQHYRYDSRGNLAATLSDSGKIRTDYLYNPANQPLYIAAPIVKQGGAATHRLVTAAQYAYLGGPAKTVSCYNDPLDAQGNLSAPLDNPNFLLRQVTTQYGAAQEVKSLSGSTVPLDMAYDRAYQLTGLSYDHNQASKFQYDNGGNLIRHTWPGGKFSSAAYDDKANLLSTTTVRGTKATLTYSDDHTGVKSLTYANAATPNLTLPNATYTHDAFGRVTQARDATTQMDYAYDDSDNVISVITRYKAAPNTPASSVPPAQEVDYAYNTNGTIGKTDWYAIPAQQGRVAPEPTVQLAAFKPAGRKQQDQRIPLIDLTDPLSRGCFPSSTNQTIYNPALPNDPLQAILNNNYTYDSDGHLIQQTDDDLDTTYCVGDDCLGECEHNFPPHNEAQRGQPAASVGLAQFNGYAYDPLHNLLGYTATYPTFFKANLSGQVTATVGYTYDEAHQRDRLLREQRTLADQNATQATDFDFAYAPNPADNLTTLRSNPTVYTFNPDNQITNAGFAYDDDGNLTAAPGTAANNGATLTYDAANRLTSYVCGTVSLSFGYRPDGLRAWKQNGATRTYYFYNGGKLQYEMQQQTDGTWAMSRCFAWGAKGIFESWTPSQGRIAYLFDPQGNVVSRRTQSGPTAGQWQDVRVYDAYGKLQDYDTNVDQSDPVGYNGQSGYYTDVPSLAANGSVAAQSGLVLCTYRYYSPDLARWLTRDPLGYEGGINVYAYCGDNPIGHADPSGLETIVTRQGQNLIFDTYIVFYGPAATAANVNRIIEQISHDWNFAYDNEHGTAVFRIHYVIVPDNTEAIALALILNPEYDVIRLANGSDRSNVVSVSGSRRKDDLSYWLGHTGTWYMGDTREGVPSHEYGHLVGLGDRYVDIKDAAGKVIGSTPDPGYEESIMGTPNALVSRDDLRRLINSVFSHSPCLKR